MANHTIIQEVDELLVRSPSIEPSAGAAGFYSNVFVLPKHTGDLWIILKHKQFNHNICIPTFMMPTIRQVWQLIQRSDYPFSVNVKNAYIFLLLSITLIFMSFLVTKTLSAEGFTIWAGYRSWGFHFTYRTHTVLLLMKGFSCHCIFGWQFSPDSLKLCCQEGTNCFVPSFVHHGLHINFSKSELHLPEDLPLLELFWNMVDMSICLPSDKLLEKNSWLILCYSFNQWTCTTWLVVSCHSEWHLECLPFFSSFILFFYPFSFTTVSVRETVWDAAESIPFVISSSRCANHYRCCTKSLGFWFSGFRIIFILSWNLIRVYAHSSYCLAETLGCCTHAT